MKKSVKIVVGLCALIMLGGCSFGFVPRHLTPVKGYGERWIKPGMTVDSCRADWVACGGMSDGGYATDPRFPGETDDFKAVRRTVKHLSVCMKSKGYQYQCDDCVNKADPSLDF